MGALIRLTRDGVGVNGGGFCALLALGLTGVTTVDGFLNVEASAFVWERLETGLRFLDASSDVTAADFRFRVLTFAAVTGICIGFVWTFCVTRRLDLRRDIFGGCVAVKVSSSGTCSLL